MKSKEEFNQLKDEYESFAKKIKELTPEELKKVIGGVDIGICLGLADKLFFDKGNPNAQNGKSMPNIIGMDTCEPAIHIEPNSHRKQELSDL